MSVMALNRGYKRTPLDDNPQDDDDAISQYQGSAAEAAMKGGTSEN